MATQQITINGGTITMGNVLELPMPYGDIRDGFEVIINHTDARALTKFAQLHGLVFCSTTDVHCRLIFPQLHEAFNAI